MVRASSSSSRRRLRTRNGGDGPIAHSLVRGTLRAIARQRPGLAGAHATGLLDFLESSDAVARSLTHQLGQTGVSENEFAVLVALFAIDPGPVPVRDLSSYTDLTSPALEAALTRLVRRRFVQRRPAEVDRHTVCLRLTSRGRRAAETTALAYLHTLATLGERLEPRMQNTLVRTCRRLAHAVDAAAPSPFRVQLP